MSWHLHYRHTLAEYRDARRRREKMRWKTFLPSTPVSQSHTPRYTADPCIERLKGNTKRQPAGTKHFRDGREQSKEQKTKQKKKRKKKKKNEERLRNRFPRWSRCYLHFFCSFADPFVTLESVRISKQAHTKEKNKCGANQPNPTANQPTSETNARLFTNKLLYKRLELMLIEILEGIFWKKKKRRGNQF
jgi:hypothetical protein